MKHPIRIVIALLALAGAISWTAFTAQLWRFGNSFKGMGDGAGAGDGGTPLLDILLIGTIWLLPVSSYLCIAAGSLNFIAGRSLRIGYVYSLAVLSIMALGMLLSFQWRFEFMALLNVLTGGLWMYICRGNTPEKSGMS